MSYAPVLTNSDRLMRMTSRSSIVTSRNLGIIEGSGQMSTVKKYRDDKLEILDAYYENRQYDGLVAWDEALKRPDHVPVRERKPRISHNFARMLTGKIASKLVGSGLFPALRIEDDPDTTDFMRAVVQASRMQNKLVEPIRRMAASGSVLVRYFIINGSMQMEHFRANHCYPTFLPNGELAHVRIQYVYFDKEDLDAQGKPKQKWFRLDLGSMADVLFDNPEFHPNEQPAFVPVQTANHGLGFVQAEWFRTAVQKESPDGVSLICDILDFIDEFNYNLSQSSQAISYNQDPQLALKGMDEDEINQLIRSSTKGWNLGKDGEASFLESTLVGTERGGELRSVVKNHIQDLARVIILDPEKIVGSAQSAKAMEILHGPFLDLINELRPVVEESIIKLTQKMALTILMLDKMSVPVPIDIPPDYVPQSLNLIATWPPVFPLTIEDLQKRVSWINAASNANLISRETGTRLLAPDFGVDDVEAELAKIAAQPILNPFGGF